MRGAMSATYNHWRREIVSCLAHVEAYIDFAEDELDVTDEVFDAVAPRYNYRHVAINARATDSQLGACFVTLATAQQGSCFAGGYAAPSE